MTKLVTKLIGVFCIIGVLGTTSLVSANPPDIWGAKHIVSHMSLNTTGFISWLKVVNPGSIDEPIEADIIWTLADGTEGSVQLAPLGSADAGGIATVSEASILAAMGDPTQLADVSLVIYMHNPDVIVTAEKKASDGRVGIPVERFYLLTEPFPCQNGGIKFPGGIGACDCTGTGHTGAFCEDPEL